VERPIIPIPRASEILIEELINMGILEVAEDGIKCKEIPTTDRESA